LNVLYLLLFASLAVAAGFLGAYLWSVRKGQFDDTATPPVRILFDEEDTGPSPADPMPAKD
jgi:cbb3-type cytochrome oxidase maturation protein